MPSYFDIHTHTRLCKHAALVSTREYIDKAAEIGLKGIAVCCHNPIEGDNYDIYRMDMSEFDTFLEYYEDAKQYAAEKYPNLEIIKTLEVDYVPERWDSIKKFLETRCSDFDAFLGSVHFNSVSEREYINSLSPSDVLKEYYKRFEEAVKTHFFDTMSHPRFYIRRTPSVDPEEEKEYIQRAVKMVADEGICMEMNTSACKFGGDIRTYINDQEIELCKDYGVPITIGSDAHDPSAVGKLFEEAGEYLKSKGVSKACYFRKHHRVEYDL